MGDELTTFERDEPVGGVATVGAVVSLALGFGFLAFVGFGFLALAFSWSVRVAVGASGLVVLAVAVAWFGKVEGLWWSSERVTRGAPPTPAASQSLSVEVIEPESRRLRYLDLPGDVGQLQALASGLLAGRTFAEAEWTGSGRLYSKAEFRQLRGQLLERGILTWRNSRAPSQGVELTAVGKAVFRSIVEDTTRTTAHARTGQRFALVDREGQGG